jgi:membrane protease YdiL (CAAX protease family)
LYAGAIAVSLAEVFSLFTARLVTGGKLNFTVNEGLAISPAIALVMSLFPGYSPIAYEYPFLVVPAVIGGICEELIYREYIIGGGKYDVYVQALLWSTNHVLDGPYFFLFTIAVGIALGLVSKRYGVLPCVVSHVIANVVRILL